jgi:hypothetical protein
VVTAAVGDLARSWVRCEDVADGSAAEDGGAHRLDGERREEEPRAARVVGDAGPFRY